MCRAGGSKVCSSGILPEGGAADVRVLLNEEKKDRAWVPISEVSKILNSAGFSICTSLSVFQFLIQPNKYYLA